MYALHEEVPAPLVHFSYWQPAHSVTDWHFPPPEEPPLPPNAPPLPVCVVLPLQAPFEQYSLSVQHVVPHTLGAAEGHLTHSPADVHVSSLVQQWLVPHRLGASSGHLRQVAWLPEPLHTEPLGQQAPVPQELESGGQPQVSFAGSPPYRVQPPARQHLPPQRSGWSPG